MRRLRSGKHAASKRVIADTDEVLNLEAIRASEEKFAHKRKMKSPFKGSDLERDLKKNG